MAIRTYQILDVGLAVESPKGAFLEAFHQNYSLFEVPELQPGNRLTVRFEDGCSGNGCFFEVDGVRESLEEHARPDLYATQALPRILMERVAVFTVLHAAVVSSSRGALAISGPSGAGKTTLALEFLKAGWIYYSDDFCPLHRQTGLVHPFPRRPWVRPASGEKARHQRRGKLPVAVESQALPIGGSPCPLRWLVYLGEEAGRIDGCMGTIQLNLRKGRGELLLEELRRLDGVITQAPDPSDTMHWALRFPRNAASVLGIKHLLHQYRSAIWEVFSHPEFPPDFSQEPVLVAIPPHEAAFFLLQELRHDLGDAMRPGALRPGALLGHLLGLLSGVACYRLTPGPLDRRLALLQAAMDPVNSR